MVRQLASLIRGRVLFDEPLARHTTLRVGGPVDALVCAKDAHDVQAAVRFCGERGIFCRALGGGSNLLVRDGGVRGVLIATGDLATVRRVNETCVEAGAGLSTARLLKHTVEWELGGMEFLAGVPGTVGGGLLMNAGTYLGEFKDVTMSVVSIAASGERVTRDLDACGFVYRGSAIPPQEIVVLGKFALRERPHEAMEADISALRAKRDEREPKGFPNAGSIFKNPPGDYAGRLIEQAGLKGRRVGGAEISTVHANWFVNRGGATADDFSKLIELASREVEKKFAVRLALEVRVVGEERTL